MNLGIGLGLALRSGLSSELDFHIWNANWRMKCEAKMAAHGSQFLDVSFSPLRGLVRQF